MTVVNLLVSIVIDVSKFMKETLNCLRIHDTSKETADMRVVVSQCMNINITMQDYYCLT